MLSSRRVFDAPIQSQFGLAVAGRVQFSDLAKAIIPEGNSATMKGLQRGVTTGRKKKIVGLLENLDPRQLNVTEQWHVSVTTDVKPGNKRVDIQELLATAKEIKILDGGGRFRSFQKLALTDAGWNEAPIQVMIYINPTRLEELQAIWILNFRRTPMTVPYQVWLYASMMRDPEFELPESGKDRNDHLYARLAWELAHNSPLAGHVKFHDTPDRSAKLTIANIFKGLDASEKAVKYFPTIDASAKSVRERLMIYVAIWAGFQQIVGSSLLVEHLYCDGPSVFFNLVTAAGLEILRKHRTEKLYEHEMVDIVAAELAEPWRQFNEQYNSKLTFAGDAFDSGGDAAKMRTKLLDMITSNRGAQVEAEREAERVASMAKYRADRAALKAALANGDVLNDTEDDTSTD